MVLESTIICVDNSEFMRNGDFLPTRLHAQQEAVNLVCHSKTRSNPENNVGLLTMSNSPQVLTTLTSDVGRILAKLHQVQPEGSLNFLTGIRIAHLALKHRQGKNHKMRIIVFVGSPLEIDEKELVKLAKRLKKEKVNVDIINFGEEAKNSEKLKTFINTLNGKEERGGSHCVTVPSGPHLSETLISSPIIQGEDGASGMPGAGYEFGFDPNEDPELALALRVSMEEQRQRQEETRRQPPNAAVASTSGPSEAAEKVESASNPEEALLEKALAMSLETGGKPAPEIVKPPTIADVNVPDFATMSEEEQIAYAMHMSLQQAHENASKGQTSASPESPVPMETDDAEQKKDELQSVLENLPGIDPNSVEKKESEKKEQEKKKDQDKNKP